MKAGTRLSAVVRSGPLWVIPEISRRASSSRGFKILAMKLFKRDCCAYACHKRTNGILEEISVLDIFSLMLNTSISNQGI